VKLAVNYRSRILQLDTRLVKLLGLEDFINQKTNISSAPKASM
jgi:hypothetical protein